jgi:hypothetical protein
VPVLLAPLVLVLLAPLLLVLLVALVVAPPDPAALAVLDVPPLPPLDAVPVVPWVEPPPLPQWTESEASAAMTTGCPPKSARGFTTFRFTTSRLSPLRTPPPDGSAEPSGSLNSSDSPQG